MLAVNEAAIKAQGAYEAWADLLKRFTEKQRMDIANMLAHGWEVNGIQLAKGGTYKVYTPEAKHSPTRRRGK